MARSDPEKPVVSLAEERERTIARLGELFAGDAITLEELERLIEQAYRAPDVAALEKLTGERALRPRRDSLAPAPASRVPDLYVPEEGRIVSIMSETKRRGLWQLPRRLEVWSVMSETRLDLTDVALPSGITEIDLSGIMTTVKITVPRHVRVVVQTTTFMATVSDVTEEPPPVGSGAPVLRITGFLALAELKIKVAP
jgi:hypothetical protein